MKTYKSILALISLLAIFIPAIASAQHSGVSHPSSKERHSGSQGSGRGGHSNSGYQHPPASHGGHAGPHTPTHYPDHHYVSPPRTHAQRHHRNYQYYVPVHPSYPRIIFPHHGEHHGGHH